MVIKKTFLRNIVYCMVTHKNEKHDQQARDGKNALPLRCWIDEQIMEIKRKSLSPPMLLQAVADMANKPVMKKIDRNLTTAMLQMAVTNMTVKPMME